MTPPTEPTQPEPSARVEPGVDLSVAQTEAMVLLGSLHGSGAVRRFETKADVGWVMFRTGRYDWCISREGRVVGWNDLQTEEATHAR